MSARLRVTAAVVVAIAVMMFGAPAEAVVGGEPTGSMHSNVGALSTGCSGVLVSATVVVTAAHCTGGDFPVDRVRVTFAPVISEDGPWIMGTPHFDARYLDLVRHGGTKAFLEQSPYDLGVVILDHPATDSFPGIRPAVLPALLELDALSRSSQAKRSDAFTFVGYGATREGSNPHSFLFDGTRRSATGPLFRLDPGLLWTKGSPNTAWGTGNPCYADSGGPAFVGTSETVGGVLSFGKDPLCQNIDGYVRLDTASARSFLAMFVPVP